MIDTLVEYLAARDAYKRAQRRVDQIAEVIARVHQDLKSGEEDSVFDTSSTAGLSPMRARIFGERIGAADWPSADDIETAAHERAEAYETALALYRKLPENQAAGVKKPDDA